MNATRSPRLSICAAALPLLLAACSQANSDTVADLQQKVIAAEARATAAEKRAKQIETETALHNQEPPSEDQQAAPPEIAENGEGNFGQPMNDTVPIDPVPVLPAANHQ